MTTAVAFIIFNRPDTTEKVFAEIRRAQPPRLYLIADGPRTPGEKLLTDATRTIAEQVDWRCDVVKLYSDENLGCRWRVISGLNAVFEREDQAIILEDDCLPDPSFFTFCETMLKRYQDDFSIMHIGGTNFQYGKKIGTGDYYFSNYVHVWGWASWKRAWKRFNIQVKSPTLLRNEIIPQITQNDENHMHFWVRLLDSSQRPDVTAWSPNWIFSIWEHQGKSIIPNKNLVLNIGFDKRATHTKGKDQRISKIPLETLFGNIIRPENNSPEFEADSRTFYRFYYKPFKKITIKEKILFKIRKMFAE
jgi:hypothetical protein